MSKTGISAGILMSLLYLFLLQEEKNAQECDATMLLNALLPGTKKTSKGRKFV